MRICLFTSNVDIAALDKETLLSRLSSSIDPNTVTEMHALTYRLPKPGLDLPNLHFLPGEETIRMTICRRLFRIIDGVSWIPAFVALLPLWLCFREICETLVATDPDVILFFDIRWGKYLQRLLRKHYQHWTFITPPHQPLPSTHPSRTFNPSSSVSIILPTYNGSRYIRQSVESCLAQTYKNIELIVVDDGSTEDMAALLRPYTDSRLKYVTHEKNLGLPHALNTGFRHSTGQYLTWTSDDNYFADTAIEEMLRFMQTYPGVDFVYAQSYIIDEKDGHPPFKIRRIDPPEYLPLKNVIGACFLYKRIVYHAIGDYNSRFFLAEDYDYWIRAARQFRMQRLFRPLHYYRCHPASLTSRYNPKIVAQVTNDMRRFHKV